MSERNVSISVPQEVADAIQERVEAGRYTSTAAVIEAAVDALHRQEQAESDTPLDLLRDKIRRSIDDPRENLTTSDVRQHLDALYSRHRR